MQLSSGAKKELLILFFCKAIFQTSLEMETIGAIKRERSNKAHKINNQLDRRINSLMERITATIDATISPEVASWVKSKTKGLLFSVLTRIAQKQIQLETFAFYLMDANFCGRKQKLHQIFEQYTDASLYFDNIILLKDVNVDDNLENDMMNLAHDVIKQLKA